MTKKGKTSPSVSRALFALTVFLTGFVFGYRLLTCKRQDFSLKSEQLFALFFAPALYPLKPFINSPQPLALSLEDYPQDSLTQME